VAAACSGVRSLMALAALTLLVGYSEFPRLGAAAGRVGAVSAADVSGQRGADRGRGVFAGQWFGQRAGERVHEWAGFLFFWWRSVKSRCRGGGDAAVVAGEGRGVERRAWSSRGGGTERLSGWRVTGLVVVYGRGGDGVLGLVGGIASRGRRGCELRRRTGRIPARSRRPLSGRNGSGGVGRR